MWLVWWNFPKTEIHLWWKVWLVWWNFPKTEIHLCAEISQTPKYTYVLKFPKDRNILTNNLNSLMKFPKERNTLMCWNFSKTKIHLQRTMSIVWCNFPKTEIHLWWKVSIVWWNLHQLSDSHTGCTSIPLPNHMGNIKGGLVVGQWQQNGGAHWSNCRCLPPYS